MHPYVENTVISLLTAVVTVVGMITATSAGTERDWAVIIATGVGTFATTFLNGMRQLKKIDPAS
jgi:hypothetical protein